MIQNVSEDEIIEVCPFITNNLIKSLEDFEDVIEQFAEEYTVLSRIFNLEDLTIHEEVGFQHSLTEFLKGVRNQIQENKNYLETVNQRIEELGNIKYTLLELVAKNQQQLKRIQAKISKIQKKKETLQEKRDKIEICKLLTNTSFTYEEGMVCGYVVGKTSKLIECFELDSEKLSQPEITDHLYSVLKKISNITVGRDV